MTNSTQFPKQSHRRIERVGRPFKEFMAREASSGIILIGSVIIALVVTNSFFHDDFEHFWEIKFGIQLDNFSLILSLHYWINDFLMAMFFLLIGLEIKRELLIGELSSVKKALLPTVAATGGMVVPALFYLLFNPPGSPGERGWAAPMATDIAFALGILFLLGKRVPTSIRVFLASLAIVDDIGAVLIIAFFYSSSLNYTFLLYAGIVLLLLLAINKMGISRLAPYLFLGIILWYFVFVSGVHATIAGVLLAFTIPTTTQIDYNDFRILSTNLVNQMNLAVETQDLGGKHLKIYQNTVQTLEKACEEVVAPLQELEHSLASMVTFVIMPIFALSNAGVVLSYPIGELFSNRIVLGIMAGLIIGKPLGIFGFTYLADKYGIIQKPKNLNWYQILGAGFLGGIGFTMAIFISHLAFPAALFPSGQLIGLTKIAILISSTICAIIGMVILLYSSKLDK